MAVFTVTRILPSPLLDHSRPAVLTPRRRTGSFRLFNNRVPTTFKGSGIADDSPPGASTAPLVAFATGSSCLEVVEVGAVRANTKSPNVTRNCIAGIPFFVLLEPCVPSFVIDDHRGRSRSLEDHLLTAS